VFARKVLKKGLDDDDMRMEEDVLRVIDKQGHDNIIDIIAFYSWRDEVNFVFPFVELNLYHVLHHDWRPEHVAEPSHIDCRGHWLWQQLIGVADALRTIHNPPIQSWPDSGKIVGFHFDLKPANVMVRHDGRLLVTDFGQSMVKLVQENEPIYGDYIGGDYAYQPPEVCPSRTVWKETLRSIEPSPSPLPTSPPGTVITSSSSRKNSSGTVASSERRRESKRSWGSSAIYRADDSSLSHAASYSLSEVSPSATSDVSRVTATTNYDVWSLACIMVEALVFICKDGSRGVIAFEGDRQSEERDLSFHDGNANAQLKKCVTKILAEIRVLERVVDGTVPIQRPSYLCDIVDMLGGMFCSDPKERLSSEEVVNKLESIGKAHEDDESPDDPMLMRMESMPIPRGFKEVGWSPNGMDVGVTSFYHMSALLLRSSDYC
jgi:serine/threonine protein kinase